MPITPRHLRQWKQQGRPIAALTAWDFAIASILDEAGIDLVLVGDSLATVALGHATTLPLTLEDMIHHVQAVQRGCQQALIVSDLPFLSYQTSPEAAIAAAGRLLKETNAQAVKLEGGYPRLLETVQRLVEVGIPVMGHVGLTPQSVRQLGYRQQGQTPAARQEILDQALALEAAGAFSIVLEHIPTDLAATITAKLGIPTIGIGAGPHCDGQILVTADLIGLTSAPPPFAPVYVNLREQIETAVQRYAREVRDRQFLLTDPLTEH